MKRKTRPNWARKVREMILFSVLCTVYCGRGCVSLESEYGKELAQSLKEKNQLRVWNFCCGRRATTETRGVLRGPRGPKKLKTKTGFQGSCWSGILFLAPGSQAPHKDCTLSASPLNWVTSSLCVRGDFETTLMDKISLKLCRRWEEVWKEMYSELPVHFFFTKTHLNDSKKLQLFTV